MTRQRIIGEVSSHRPGPTIICVGSLHGSEPAGALAAERFLKQLKGRAGTLSGRFLALRGNIPALQIGRRFIDLDLNRIWQPDLVNAMLAGASAPGREVEYQELYELATVLRGAFDSADGPVCLVDLHSTSSESDPFFWLIPSPGAEALLPRYGVPIVYDPETRIAGTMGQCVASFGHDVIIAEGGQHDSPDTVVHHEAILWITLEHLGCLREVHVDGEVEQSRALHNATRRSLPLLHAVVYHHKISESDEFRMRPGYRTFQSVEAGEVVADDRHGEIRVPTDGRILMPLYRPPCEDGFLIVRETSAWPRLPA